MVSSCIGSYLERLPGHLYKAQVKTMMALALVFTYASGVGLGCALMQFSKGCSLRLKAIEAT